MQHFNIKKKKPLIDLWILIFVIISPWALEECVFKRIGSQDNRDHHREILHSRPSSFFKHACLLFYHDGNFPFDFYCFYSKLMIPLCIPLFWHRYLLTCCGAHSVPPRQEKEILMVNGKTIEKRCSHGQYTHIYVTDLVFQLPLNVSDASLVFFVLRQQLEIWGAGTAREGAKEDNVSTSGPWIKISLTAAFILMYWHFRVK